MKDFFSRRLKAIAVISIIFFVLLLVFFSGCAKPVTNTADSERKGFNSTERKTQSPNETKPDYQPEEEQLEEEAGRYEKALVTRVIDGDTIVVLLDGREEKVRLIGIDTPEKGRPYFYEATRKTAELVLGKEVKLEKDVSERDKYGRLLRYVYAGGLFVNAELVRHGYAMVYTYPPDVKYSDYFLKLQQEARDKNLGLWGIESENSVSKENGNSNYYVASKKSDVFHYPDCIWAKKISPYNLIKFPTREDALNSGRRPCKVCNP